MKTLDSELSKAEFADLQKLGAALTDGRRPPAAEAPKVRETLEEVRRQHEALGYAAQRASVEIATLPQENRIEWLQQAQRELANASRTYRTAIEQLAKARDSFGEVAAMTAFLVTGEQSTPVAEWITVKVAGENKNIPSAHLVDAMQQEIDLVADRINGPGPDRPRPGTDVTAYFAHA